MKPVVVIDDVHLLKSRILDEFRIFYDFDFDSIGYVSVILIGNEGIRNSIRKVKYESLRDLIVANYEMRGMDREEPVDKGTAHRNPCLFTRFSYLMDNRIPPYVDIFSASRENNNCDVVVFTNNSPSVNISFVSLKKITWKHSCPAVFHRLLHRMLIIFPSSPKLDNMLIGKQ